MLWTTESVGILIDEYQKYPCLYIIKHPLYHNRNSRTEGLKNISEIVNSVRPGTTIEEIKTKWSSLRSTYIAEKRKYENSLKSGSGTDYVYKPSLWYFDRMSFLNEHVAARPSTSSFSMENMSPSSSITSGDIIICDEEGVELDCNEEAILSDDVSIVSDHNYQKSNACVQPSRPSKRQKMSSNLENSVLENASTALKAISQQINSGDKSNETQKTDITLFGELVAARLQNIKNKKNQLRVQFEIDQIIYKYLLDD
ncbi:hypothetical protein FQR65_LT17618 [Abscondita terminalis]|nr:hypothetical protein FQR65_LT17618 [Abscondita terminalis]